MKFCDLSFVERKLREDITPELAYQKTDGTWMKLQILKFKTYKENGRETLWIFTNMDTQM